MRLTELHATLLSQAFERVLGVAKTGSVAYVRCLTGDIVDELAAALKFTPSGWRVQRVADRSNPTTRTITADQAVEMREEKGIPVLLLVDTALAGAGMDGIYSAAREVQETELFEKAIGLAAKEISRQFSRQHRLFTEQAVKKARSRGRRMGVSPWAEFDLFVRGTAESRYPGEFLYLIGLWPIKQDDDVNDQDALENSVLFVQRLLGRAPAAATPTARIASLKLLNPTDEQIRGLGSFLQKAVAKPFLNALADLRDKPELWVNALHREGPAHHIQGIELISWRNRNGQIARWSGLIPEGDEKSPPVFILKLDAEKTSDYSKLEVHWKARPSHLEKGGAEYRVALVTDMDEELAVREVLHSARKEEKCRFTNDDFSTLSDNALISAKAVLSVIGNDNIEPQESEEFEIRFGELPEHERIGAGKTVRTFSDGLIELADRGLITEIASTNAPLQEVSKGFVLLRTPQRGKTFRVFRPPLIREVENRWAEENGAVGRWQVKVRASGVVASPVEFVRFVKPQTASGTCELLLDRVEAASRRIAERFGSNGGGVGQIYDEKARGFDNTVKEYLLAWAALLDSEVFEPFFSLVNTVEVQSLSGRTIGLIVLPSHPLRMAWHVAYDNLVFHARYEQNLAPKDVREELKALDGAMFPSFLPGLNGQGTFVFADILGFHAVGMVPDRDKEPKAAVALLARALGESETGDSAPTVGKQSAEVLGKEIIKYLECHGASSLLHIHALRPGDGMTVARSLGKVCEYLGKSATQETDTEGEEPSPAFVLELYPSEFQRGVAGRFISEVCERRRSGAGTLSTEDVWMLESLNRGGGVAVPRLRWARRDEETPQGAAHLAAAFDTFESHVITVSQSQLSSKRPLFAFGLFSFFERRYSSQFSPRWDSFIPHSTDGEKHPSDPFHTKRLLEIQNAIQKTMLQSLGAAPNQWPLLRTEISSEKADSLRTLHALCDWVITVDRNAGIEYFDSPRENLEIYNAYVIDCVPEREDLGCLQLITSTSNLDEVRNLLDTALDQMGLSRSLRNAEFLLWHLKALSGRLAIRLTGRKAATGELIALALTHANCFDAKSDDDAWTSLANGFFVPVDDIRDLSLPLSSEPSEGDTKVNKELRPDMIHVSQGGRGALLFRFVEVKYRRHLRAVRNPEEMEHIRKQMESMRNRWMDGYFSKDISAVQRSIRRLKLARVLRFYADKARRHYLEDITYKGIIAEIDKMVSSGGTYSVAVMEKADRGFIFCPEYAGQHPLEISPADWDSRVFLFGPGRLPDSNFRTIRDKIANHVQHTDAELSISADGPGSAKNSAADSEEEEVNQLIEKSTITRSFEQPEEKAPAIPTNTLKVCLGDDVLANIPVEWLPSTKGHPHLLMVGLSGMGKTTCLINICRQIKEQGAQFIVFSYHQDIDDRIEALFGGVRFVDYNGLGFNPLCRPAQDSKRTFLDVAGELRDIFLAIYPELGDIQGEGLRQALKESYLELGWNVQMFDQMEFPDPPFGRFVEILRSKPKKDRGSMTLLARLQELEDYGFFRSSEDHGSLWESNQPIVIRIHSTQNENVQRAFASLLFYGLYKEMFYRKPQDRLTHFIIFDEAHRAARLKLIPTMAQECRKYGIGLVLASQQTRDFDVRLFSLIANYLVLRLTDQDAKALVRNVTSSDQERVLIDRIKQLEKYRAFFFCEGHKRPANVALALP
jgi:DNA polymerase III delta prime subunit